MVDNDVSEAEDNEGELPQTLLELEKEVLTYPLIDTPIKTHPSIDTPFNQHTL